MLEHIQIFNSSLCVVPFIFKPVFVCVHTENADENWLENEGTTCREEGNIWICYSSRSRDFISESELSDPDPRHSSTSYSPELAIRPAAAAQAFFSFLARFSSVISA